MCVFMWINLFFLITSQGVLSFQTLNPIAISSKRLPASIIPTATFLSFFCIFGANLKSKENMWFHWPKWIFQLFYLMFCKLRQCKTSLWLILCLRWTNLRHTKNCMSQSSPLWINQVGILYTKSLLSQSQLQLSLIFNKIDLLNYFYLLVVFIIG